MGSKLEELRLLVGVHLAVECHSSILVVVSLVAFVGDEDQLEVEEADAVHVEAPWLAAARL